MRREEATCGLDTAPPDGIAPLVLIGPRGVVKTPARGLFHCPRCDASRAYSYRRFRRFFFLFYLPVLRLEGEAEFVQCGFCRHVFQPSILESGGLGDPRWANREVEVPGWLAEQLAGAAASRLLVWESETD